jgi:hypothetical protein
LAKGKDLKEEFSGTTNYLENTLSLERDTKQGIACAVVVTRVV